MKAIRCPILTTHGSRIYKWTCWLNRFLLPPALTAPVCSCLYTAWRLMGQQAVSLSQLSLGGYLPFISLCQAFPMCFLLGISLP